MNKFTLVVGASLNENRYSHTCVKTLVSGHLPVIALGLKEGIIAGVPVQTGFPPLENVQTVTIYLGAPNQKIWYDYILGLNPERVIFNPGAENQEFRNALTAAGIEAIEDCTIRMVEGGRF